MVGVSVSKNRRGAQILQFVVFFVVVVVVFFFFFIKQLLHSRLLDIKDYAPRWLSTISYPTRACGIIVYY